MNYSEDIWNGFKRLSFDADGREAFLVLPKIEKNGKWLLKTEYFGAFPDFEIEMLKRGYSLAYVSNSTRWHRESDDDAKAELAVRLQKEFGLSDKCMPVGMSCGGMHAVYFAAKYPEYVAALYLDAPVLNLLSCPCGVGEGTDEMYGEFLRDRGITVSQLINYRSHPIDKVPALIMNRIPVFLVCGDSDGVVPYPENGEILAQMYENSGVPFEKVVKPGCGHHPHGLSDLKPLIDFAEKYY